MTETASTAPQSLAGFEWQVHRSLLALFDLRVGQLVEIEVFDDVTVRFEGGTLLTALQTKHAFDDGTLTLRAVEWWKTLRAWIQLGTAGKLTSETTLLLCTTLTVSEDLLFLTEDG